MDIYAEIPYSEYRKKISEQVSSEHGKRYLYGGAPMLDKIVPGTLITGIDAFMGVGDRGIIHWLIKPFVTETFARAGQSDWSNRYGIDHRDTIERYLYSASKIKRFFGTRAGGRILILPSSTQISETQHRGLISGSIASYALIEDLYSTGRGKIGEFGVRFDCFLATATTLMPAPNRPTEYGIGEKLIYKPVSSLKTSDSVAALLWNSSTVARLVEAQGVANPLQAGAPGLVQQS